MDFFYVFIDKFACLKYNRVISSKRFNLCNVKTELWKFLAFKVAFCLNINQNKCEIMSKKNDLNKNNICLFRAPDVVKEEGLGVITMVYEKNAIKTDRFITAAVFSLCVVSKGKGIYRTLNGSYSLKRGDVFLIMPASTYYISNIDNLEFMYVKFSSIKAFKLIESVNVNKLNCYFEGKDVISDIWENIFASGVTNFDMCAEGLITLSLSCLNSRTEIEQKESKTQVTNDKILKIIEENYCDCNFNLTVLAEKLFFNPKYLSTLFKQYFKVNFSTYLTELRMNNATNLISSGFTSIKEISQLSGFSDPLYFSKAFKKINGISPSEYILKEKNKNKNKN